MSITSLTTTHFRNLTDHKQLVFHKKLNLVVGENASGKTSLLEAIYFLSTGKSFRSRLIENIVRSDNQTDHFILYGKLQSDLSVSDNDIAVGIKRSKKEKPIIKVDDELVSSASSLAALSPTLIIQPASFELLEGSPKVRRKFLDWGVFHVEHTFGTLWKEYIYCLKQRNTLLRSVRIDDLQLRIWDKRLVELGEDIDNLRTSFLERYTECLAKLLREFNLPENLVVRYYKGWEKTKSFSEALSGSLIKDKERRYTQHGPQRADIRITLDGKNAEQTLSRGQQKLLILAMHLTHIALVSQLTNKASVTLIDDITAELDQKNLTLIFKCLTASKTQVICTGIEGSRIKDLLIPIESEQNYKMFHVEHGEITEN